ncbi:hypothetical protein QCA50_008146 [Cerrena zonata]|uniref:Uncharacterized protein n=1 Tax=Cerrena zonata TaxID=2478898 RepID=A0AAW0GES8_9APHY
MHSHLCPARARRDDTEDALFCPPLLNTYVGRSRCRTAASEYLAPSASVSSSKPPPNPISDANIVFTVRHPRQPPNLREHTSLFLGPDPSTIWC